jgi:hypothetical protein
MDALARLAPVAWPLLRDVDSALATLGAPADHPVWGLLRRIRTTPADAVGFFADLGPETLRAAAATLLEQATTYDAAAIPLTLPWEGSAADFYTVSATALSRHLRGDETEPLAGRLRAMGSHVDGVADWRQRSRDDMARVVASALTSSQAVTVRSCQALGRGLAEVMRHADSGVELTRAVASAADIGAAVLGVAEDAVVAARNLHQDAAAGHSELTYRAPAQSDPVRYDGTIRLHH